MVRPTSIFAAGLTGAVLAAASAAAQPSPPDYLDDRSTPEAVIRSLYNAVDRKEYLRAYSYFDAEAEIGSFDAFASGYADTRHASVRTGEVRSEGAAGSVYYIVPTAIEAQATGGARQVYAGCYTLRLVQPAIQATPPFRPMGIVKGNLVPAEEPLERAMPDCSPDGAGTAR